jgi:hypothetical protein
VVALGQAMIARLAALWRQARAFLIVLTAFASGVGIYAGWQAIDAKDKCASSRRSCCLVALVAAPEEAG